jgi:hypothetical protein
LVLLNNDVVVTDAWLVQLLALTTAKMGKEENGSTAKDAKSAKEDGETNGKGEFVDETPNATIVHFTDEVSASEAATATLAMTTPSPIIPGEPRTKDQGPTWRWSGWADVQLCGAAAAGRERALPQSG